MHSKYMFYIFGSNRSLLLHKCMLFKENNSGKSNKEQLIINNLLLKSKMYKII